MSVTELFKPFILEDLAESGLEIKDMRVRLAGPNEKQATNTPMGVEAYTIPYFDIHEKPLPFYRNKLIDSPDPTIKYKQLATSGNHVYFPLGFNKLAQKAQYIIITEGEKKAAAAVKHGFPCVGLGGVDSWRNRTVVLHKDSQVGQSKQGEVVVKLPAGAEIREQADTLALGMRELIDLALKRSIPIIIAFDSDLHIKGYVRFEVQRAAAALGFELRNRGVKFVNIKQLILDPEDSGAEGKLGLDDFLMNEELGPDVLRQQIHDVLKSNRSFPKHPNTREYVNRKLQKTSIARSEMSSLCTSIICDLDSNGMRLHCPDDDNMYYFDEGTHKLLKAHFTQHMEFAKTAFGRKLYDAYGITISDQRLIQVLNSQFCGEEPMYKVKPEKIMTIRGDAFYYQISDGRMVKVDAQGIRIMLNGTDNVLFEGDMVEDIPHEELSKAIGYYSKEKDLPNFWYDVLKEARIKDSPEDRMRKLLSLLYSISPWMYRWRATQLPLEQMLGEAGSGKSTLYVLRQSILAGRTALRNAPKDLRDWTASIAASGALHVTDNVHMTGGMLKQQLSDELCRVITETDPHIESRKLYTDNDLVRVPVKTVFAVTAIKQPFTNTDIIQRSIITQLDKGLGVVEYDANWTGKQLSRFGGRTHWIAHQMVFLHRLFQRIKDHWDPTYKAKYRLINIEQILMHAAHVYGLDDAWIPHFLESTSAELVASSDAALEGLIAWADAVREEHPKDKLKRMLFTTQDMVNWFEGQEEWEGNTVLINGRKLGHYIEGKKNTVAQISGVCPTDVKRNNRKTYQVVHLD